MRDAKRIWSGQRKSVRPPRLLIGMVLAFSAACGDAAVTRDFPTDNVDQTTLPTLYCDRTYSELEENVGRPYNAVGFLNNGCTAFLVDSDHIVAAAHCFADSTSGAWYTNLRFYPNFHPDRVARDARHVPRAIVERAVVGSRVDDVMGDRMDWGIAKVGNWQDAGGLDLTPIALAPLGWVPTAEGTTLTNPSYTRHHFPYDDHDNVTWDNMEWDTTFCGWFGGTWTVEARPAPILPNGNRDRTDCNTRWSSGYLHEDCWLRSLDNDLVIHNCDVVGGSSGSPILWPLWPGGGWTFAIGVVHGGGGGGTHFSDINGPTCQPYDRNNMSEMNNGPSVNRFRDAPRFASNVAVHRRPDNSYATSIFAIDSDLDRVVYRAREGTPNYTGRFEFWKNLGTPVAGGELSRIAACSYENARPEVFVTVDDEQIYTAKANADGSWQAWVPFDLPSWATGVADIDASQVNGLCELYVIAESAWGPVVTTRRRTSGQAWGSWSGLFLGPYSRITALKYNNARYMVIVDDVGDLWKTQASLSGSWGTLVKLSKPNGIAAWTDADMTWDEYGRGFMLAISSTGPQDKLYFTPIYGSNPWSWFYFRTKLWAPSAGSTQPSPRLVSITASRWMEDSNGVTSPVVFSTDDAGNVYFVEYTRIGTPRWVLDWKSFYHESIPY